MAAARRLPSGSIAIVPSLPGAQIARLASGEPGFVTSQEKIVPAANVMSLWSFLLRQS